MLTHTDPVKSRYEVGCEGPLMADNGQMAIQIEGPLCAESRSKSRNYERLLMGKLTFRFHLSKAALCPKRTFVK